MIDLALTYTGDGADLTIVDDQPKLSGGLQAAVYLSLFVPKTWADLTRDRGNRYTSRVPEVMHRGLSNTTRLELITAAQEALAWLTDDGIAQEVSVTATIDSAESVSLTVTIVQPDNVLRLAYGLNWAATTAELKEAVS